VGRSVPRGWFVDRFQARTQVLSIKDEVGVLRLRHLQNSGLWQVHSVGPGSNRNGDAEPFCLALLYLRSGTARHPWNPWNPCLERRPGREWRCARTFDNAVWRVGIWGRLQGFKIARLFYAGAYDMCWRLWCFRLSGSFVYRSMTLDIYRFAYSRQQHREH
jgi:hypothetical protein